MTLGTLAKIALITIAATILGVFVVYTLVGYILVHFILRF